MLVLILMRLMVCEMRPKCIFMKIVWFILEIVVFSFPSFFFSFRHHIFILQCPILHDQLVAIERQQLLSPTEHHPKHIISNSFSLSIVFVTAPYFYLDFHPSSLPSYRVHHATKTIGLHPFDVSNCAITQYLERDKQCIERLGKRQLTVVIV